MSDRFNELDPAPLDPIMQANAEWPNFQREFDDPINTTVGVLLDPETGAPWQPASVTNARSQALEEINEGCEFGYQTAAGNEDFLEKAKKFTFGERPWKNPDILAYQSLGGTGALSLARETVKTIVRPYDYINIGLYLDGGWPNHEAIFDEQTFQTFKAQRLASDGTYDHGKYMEWLGEAENNSVFLLQASGYNNDGMDREPHEWAEIMDMAIEKDATVIIDSAYAGLSEPVSQRGAIQAAMDRGVFTLVCASMSKNMGLYNERLGALFIANSGLNLGDKQAAFMDQAVKKIVRRTVSNMPLLVAKTGAAVLDSAEYDRELQEAKARLDLARFTLGSILDEEVPAIIKGKGLFTKLRKDGFTKEQQAYIRSQGILALPSSRINIGGLAEDKIGKVGFALLDALQLK